MAESTLGEEPKDEKVRWGGFVTETTKEEDGGGEASEACVKWRQPVHAAGWPACRAARALPRHERARRCAAGAR